MNYYSTIHSLELICFDNDEKAVVSFRFFKLSAIVLNKSRQTVLNTSVFMLWTASWQNQQNDMCAQRRLRSAWTSAWRTLGSLATHWAHSEDSDQTGRMPRLAQADLSLRWAHSRFVMRRLLCLYYFTFIVSSGSFWISNKLWNFVHVVLYAFRWIIAISRWNRNR